MATSYAKLRFLHTNLLTVSNVTASSQAAGRIGGALKTGTGAGDLSPTGDYTGTIDLTVIVQIEATGDLGTATFRWKTSATVSGWEATGIVTSASATALGTDGKQVAFSSGTDTDFVEYDTWVFYCYASFSPAQALTRDRDVRYRSAGCASTITLDVDLGSAQAVTACLLQDHNLTSGATVKLYANTSPSWTTPPYTLTLTSTDEPIVAYLSQSYRYWRLSLIDTANPDGYLEIGQLFLGTYTGFASETSRLPWGSKRTNAYNKLENTSYTGKTRRQVWTKQQIIPINLPLLDNTDWETLKALYESLFDTATGLISPLWLHYFYDTPGECYLVEWMTNLPRTFRSYGMNTVELEFQEVVKTT